RLGRRRRLKPRRQHDHHRQPAPTPRHALRPAAIETTAVYGLPASCSYCGNARVASGMMSTTKHHTDDRIMRRLGVSWHFLPDILFNQAGMAMQRLTITI